MNLQTLVVQNFRPFEQQTFALHPQVTVIVGPNTRGKTSLLEAIYTVLHGTGFRESKELELIRWDQPMGSVAAQLGDEQIQVMLRTTGESVEKHYFWNKAKQSLQQYTRDTPSSVLFTPDNIEIITGSPRRRRQFLDRVLSVASPGYRKQLINYENALRKRNKLLEQHRSKTELKQELGFWDQYLTEQATALTAGREAFVAFCNGHTALHDRTFRLSYEPNLLTVQLLQERFELESRMRRTSIGPQKDDLIIYQEEDGREKNVALYGSRSEQRLAMFWLKLQEIAYLEHETGRRPLLLLDDVFSELDAMNKAGVVSLLQRYQTVLTTTEEDLLERAPVENLVIRL